VVDESLVANSREVRAKQGRAFAGAVASFFDLGAAGPADAYAATIAWGDGTVSTGTVTVDSTGGFDVSGTHVYSRAGLFTVDVTIRDEEGSTITVSYPATVLLPPVRSLAVPVGPLGVKAPELLVTRGPAPRVRTQGSIRCPSAIGATNGMIRDSFDGRSLVRGAP
jgi:hypothetical protein